MQAAFAKLPEKGELSWLLVVLVERSGRRMLLSWIAGGRKYSLCMGTLGGDAWGTLGGDAWGTLGAGAVGTLGAGAVGALGLLWRKKASSVLRAWFVGVPCWRKGVAG